MNSAITVCTCFTCDVDCQALTPSVLPLRAVLDLAAFVPHNKHSHLLTLFAPLLYPLAFRMVAVYLLFYRFVPIADMARVHGWGV